MFHKKRLLVVFMIISSCNNSNSNKIDNRHIENLAENFMKAVVIPKMKDPKPYEILNSNVVIKTVADNIADYRFVYDHLSFNQTDSMENKKHLDSIIKISRRPDSVISITVNVTYKTRYRMGDVVIDSIKLGYDRESDRIHFWPF